MSSKHRNIPTKHKCPVCGGIIVDRTSIPYTLRVSRDLIGPGSENMATEHNRQTNGHHCPDCGIEYHQYPQPLDI